MRIAASLVCVGLVIGSIACSGAGARRTTFHRATDDHLGYVRLGTGEQAIVWQHCQLEVDGVKGIDVAIGRAPVPRVTAVVHDPAAPNAAPLGLESATTPRLRVTLSAPATGVRTLTVLEGDLTPDALARVLGAVKEPASCTVEATDEEGIIRPPESPCKPCWPTPEMDCPPCPPQCPDPPCP